MGVILEDLRGGERKLSCHWWQWRPTVELIKSFDLIERERLDLLSQGVGELAEEEAHQLAAIIDVNVLPKLKASNSTPSGGSGAYTPTKQWLTEFTDFCRVSGGIRVLY